MKPTMTAVGAAFACAAFAAAPANSQQKQAAPQQSEGEAPAAKPKVSREAVKAIQELQAAVKANGIAEIPAKVAAANAVAKSADDRYMIAVLRYQAAVNAKDDAARAAAIEAMLASRFAGAPRTDLYADLGTTYTKLKQTDRAGAAFQQALQLNPNSVSATAGLAELRAAQGQAAEALALLQKGMALQASTGTRASESWYKRAVAIAYKAKLPQAIEVSREWLKAYPTADSWQNALAIYQNLTRLDDIQTLDLLRLKRAARTLAAGDYSNYADIALRKGFSGEAKAVLDEGFAANTIKRADPSFGQLYSLASERTKGDREKLPAAPATGSTARQTLVIGDAYYGYEDYSKALEFYRAALSQGDADKNLVNLRIGMALARSGDKAGATAALNSVGGAQSDLAKYWLLYVTAQA